MAGMQTRKNQNRIVTAALAVISLSMFLWNIPAAAETKREQTYQAPSAIYSQRMGGIILPKILSDLSGRLEERYRARLSVNIRPRASPQKE